MMLVATVNLMNALPDYYLRNPTLPTDVFKSYFKKKLCAFALYKLMTELN